MSVTYQQTHLLFRLYGWFGPNSSTQTEQWVAGMRIHIPVGPFAEDKKLDFLTSLAADARTFHVAVVTGAPAECYLRELQAAYIGTDGKYVGGDSQATTIVPLATPASGVAGTPMSWDIARTYSLRTAKGRGRGHVGRFYYPCGITTGTDGRWSALDCQNAANTAKTFLDRVNTVAKDTWTGSQGLCVFDTFGEGHNQVNRVEVGRAPDTQRRRTRSLVEDYQGANLSGVLATSEVRATLSY